MKNIELAETEWRRISPKQRLIELVNSIWALIPLIAPGVVLTIFWYPWGLIFLAVGLTVYLIAIALIPRRVRNYGYQLREDDLLFRKGVMFRRFVAVPYGRMQLVDLTRGPLERGRGLATLKMITAAIGTNVAIPGLPMEEAEELRDHLVRVAESRRAGL